MNPFKQSRRSFMKVIGAGSTAATVGYLSKTFLAVPASAEVNPVSAMPPVDPSDFDFLGDGLRERGVKIANAFGRPDVADVFRTGCFSDVLTAIRPEPVELQATAIQAYMAAFPNGRELGDTLLILNNIDWSRPRQDHDAKSLASLHSQALGLRPGELSNVALTELSADAPVLLFRPTQMLDPQGTSLWMTARSNGRRVAAAAAGQTLGAAVDRAIVEAIDVMTGSAELVPPVWDQIRIGFATVARYAGQHIVLTDLLPYSNAGLPFLKMLACGVIPLGMEPDGKFAAVTVARAPTKL